MSSWWELSSPGPLLYLEPRWDTCQCLSREVKGQDAPAGTGCSVTPAYVPSRLEPRAEAAAGRGCAATANQVPQLNLLLGSLSLLLALSTAADFPCWGRQRGCLFLPGARRAPVPVLWHRLAAQNRWCCFTLSLHHCPRQAAGTCTPVR